MSNNKQSSVEWLISQLNKKGFAPVVTDDEIEQAKVMHRKEILEARQNGLDNQFANGSWDSQLYYELEFGGEK